jgi:hypothetical protein
LQNGNQFPGEGVGRAWRHGNITRFDRRPTMLLITTSAPAFYPVDPNLLAEYRLEHEEY